MSKKQKASKPGRPQAARGGVAAAAQLMFSGQSAAAEQACRALLARDPRDADALQLMGVLLGQRGATEEATALMERAVALSPRATRPLLNLGALLMESAPDRAEACFRKVLELAPQTREALGSLATLLEKAGKYEEAETRLRALLRASPGDPSALALLATVLRRREKYAEEVLVLRELMKRSPADPSLHKVLGRAYHLWFESAVGAREEALRILEGWLAFDPVDPIALHKKVVLTGAAPPERAAQEYIERHFDGFAPVFDETLDRLDYRGPQAVAELLATVLPAKRGDREVLDVGCGTGRLAPLVAPWKKRLVGIDLSKGMLEVARKRGGYDELLSGEAVLLLRERPRSFDLVTCIDTLIYFGDIAALCSGIFAALRPGGLFLGTIEVCPDDAKTFELHEGGRYAHAKPYLARVLAESGFTQVETSDFTLRMEQGAPVRGLVFSAGPRGA